MPLPFIVGGGAILAKVALGAGVAAGAVGAAKGVKGVIDTNDAKSFQRIAERTLKEAEDSMEKEKRKTSKSIEELGKTKVNILAKEMNDFVMSYQQIKNVELSDSIGIDELKKLNFSNEELTEMETISIGAIDVITGLGTGIGAGALLGWGAYGGVMALGVASTGTTISTLSGVAATNATLAWLGGGSLAVGGGGMALGTAVLGGLVAGPALLIAGGLFSSKAKEQLNNARSNLAEAKKISKELSNGELQLKIIAGYSKELKKLLEITSLDFRKNIDNMSAIVKEKLDWDLYTLEEKHQVAATVKLAILLKGIIDKPLLNENGLISSEIKQILLTRENLSLSKIVQKDISDYQKYQDVYLAIAFLTYYSAGVDGIISDEEQIEIDISLKTYKKQYSISSEVDNIIKLKVSQNEKLTFDDVKIYLDNIEVETLSVLLNEVNKVINADNNISPEEEKARKLFEKYIQLREI